MPPVRKETKVVEETIPGYPIETVTDYPVLVRPYVDRTALLLKPMIEADEEMTREWTNNFPLQLLYQHKNKPTTI